MVMKWPSIFRSKREYRASSSSSCVSGGWYPSSLSKEAAMKLSAVYACVIAISEDIAKMPLEPYIMDDKWRKVKAYDDPTYELLCLEPNPDSTRFTLIQALVASMLLNGEGFAKVSRDSSGKATSITFVPYSDVTVYVDAITERIDFYLLNRTGEVVEVEDMIHLLNFTYDGVRGLSTLSFAARTLGIANASEEHAKRFFTNGGSARGILKYSALKLKQSQRDEIRKEWEENYRNGNAVAILDGGAEYQSLSISPKDAQLLENRQFNLPEICRFFRISPVKIGDLSKSSYSTVEATNIDYITSTLNTYMVKIEQEFRRKIYPRARRSRMSVEFDPSALLRADTSAQTDLVARMIPVGVFTINEARAKLNLSPIEGGDELLTMVNMQPLKTALESAGANPNQQSK